MSIDFTSGGGDTITTGAGDDYLFGGFGADTIQPHGFRHTASTALNELGFPAEAIERQLSHRQRGIAGVYNKAQYMPERKKMMQAWADYLDGLRTSANVTPIKRRS